MAARNRRGRQPSARIFRKSGRLVICGEGRAIAAVGGTQSTAAIEKSVVGSTQAGAPQCAGNSPKRFLRFPRYQTGVAVFTTRRCPMDLCAEVEGLFRPLFGVFAGFVRQRPATLPLQPRKLSRDSGCKVNKIAAFRALSRGFSFKVQFFHSAYCPKLGEKKTVPKQKALKKASLSNGQAPLFQADLNRQKLASPKIHSDRNSEVPEPCSLT